MFGFEGGFVIAFGAARRSLAESFGARAPVALSRASWDPGAMGTGRVAEPKVRDVGCASSFNDPVKESIWFETCSLRARHF